MRNKLEGDTKFNDLEKDYNVNGLLDLIKDLVYSTNESQEPFLKMANSMVKLHRMFQCNRESANAYYKRFMSQVEVTESECGPLMPSKCKGKPTEQQEKARKQCLARLYLQALNRDHKKQVQGLSTAFINKQNNYPDTPEAALLWAVSQLETTGGHNIKPITKETQEGEVPRNMAVQLCSRPSTVTGANPSTNTSTQATAF